MRAQLLVEVVAVAGLLAATPAFGQAPVMPPAGRAATSTASSAVGETLMQHEREVIAAVVAHDLKAFSALVPPDSWQLDGHGYAKVADFVKDFDSVKAERATPSEMKVVTLGPGAALVTYKLEQKGSIGGQAWAPVVYATTAWVNHRGTWHAVFHQESTVEQ